MGCPKNIPRFNSHSMHDSDMVKMTVQLGTHHVKQEGFLWLKMFNIQLANGALHSI